MKTWLRHHAQSLVATLARLRGQPVASVLNLLAIGVTLALPLGAFVLLDNARTLARHVAGDPQMSVFLATDAGKPDGDRVGAELARAAGVRKIRFVPKEDALAELRREEGMAEIVATLKTNPLPDAFVVDLAPGESAAAESLAAKLRALPKVAQVQLDSVWVQRLDALLRLGRAAVIVLASLLATALVAVTFNTIRLQILTQSAEIEVCRMIGATDGYIRRPFFYQGALLGALGGLAAVAAVACSLAFMNTEVAALARSYGSGFRLGLPPWGDLAAVVVFAAVLGWVGAWLSVNRHLHDQ